MMHAITILPSPLLPTIAYEPLVEALQRRGRTTTIADPTLDRESTAGHLVERWASTHTGAELLVAHSNAGLLAPLVREAFGVPATPIVFVDAALLPPSGRSALAPPRFLDFVDDLAGTDGMLPPWTRWWPRDTMHSVLPEKFFDPIDAASPRLHQRYFDHSVHVPKDWLARPNAYLAFGSTYAAELEFARRNSWPYRELDGGHLHFLHDADAVADEVLRLAGPTPP